MRIAKDSMIVIAVVIAMVGVAYALIYRPQGQALAALESQTAAIKNAIDSDLARAAQVPELMRQVQQLKGRYTNFDRRLPKQKELGGFLREISANLGLERLQNQLIEPGNPTREELYNTLPIVMRFKGSYLALARFLKQMDAMERVTRVQRMFLSPDKSASGDAEILNVELQMNIYFTES